MRSFRSKLLRPATLSADDRRLWAEWCDATPGLGNAFLTSAYAIKAARVFDDVRVCRVECDGEPVAFFPFQYASRLHRLLGFAQRLGGELSDYFGVVARPGMDLPPATLLRLAGINTLMFTHLDETQAAFGLAGEQPEPGLRIDMPEGGAAYWGEMRVRDKRFIADTERRARKLVESCGPMRLVFRNTDPGQLAFLIERKREQYARTGVGDPLDAPRTQALLAQLLDGDDPQCRGVLSTLHAGDTWVASHFGLMHRGKLHYWFPVYNRELHSFSPGRMLVMSIIQEADRHGVTCIDRGAGDSQAKRDFANGRHEYFRGLWSRPGPRSLATRAGLAAGWRWERLRASRKGKEPA